MMDDDNEWGGVDCSAVLSIWAWIIYEMIDDAGAWFAAGSSGAIDDDQQSCNQVVGCVPVAVAVAKLVAQK